MFFMAVLLIAIGFVAVEATQPGAGIGGVAIAVLVWIFLSIISYYTGDTIFLKLSRAKKIKRDDHPQLFNVVEEMKIASGLPKIPNVYIIDDPAPNAFATGRNPEKASVVVTTGLLEILNRDELQGVIAHEMGHIKNRDILYMMMVSVMMGVIVLIADIAVRFLFYGGGRSRSSSSKGGGQAQLIIMVVALVLLILAPIIARLIYFAVSRKREYLADASGALYTRYPEGLARALEKISGKPLKLKSATRLTAPSFFVNPLKLTKKGLSNLTATHPPIDKRVKILRSMAGGASYLDYESAYKKVLEKPKGVMPSGALAGLSAVPLAALAAAPANDTPLKRHRETTDCMWKVNNYIFIPCPCETKLKIPPTYSGKEITCPHCGTKHRAQKPAA